MGLLASRPNQLFPRSEIIDTIWGKNDQLGYATENLKIVVQQLRRKIGPVRGQIIVNIHSQGYLLNDLSKEGGKIINSAETLNL